MECYIGLERTLQLHGGLMDVGRKTHTLLEKCCDVSTFGVIAGGWTNAFPHPTSGICNVNKI